MVRCGAISGICGRDRFCEAVQPAASPEEEDGPGEEEGGEEEPVGEDMGSEFREDAAEPDAAEGFA